MAARSGGLPVIRPEQPRCIAFAMIDTGGAPRTAIDLDFDRFDLGTTSPGSP